ncbi:MBL fold metallo-hydrolase RNA specificity domain-containing protein [Pseudomonas sp.]|uniref:MBL fold metallo-hydrolase RNA specificity domain-containing protein n=1 Tax=Pseudomonas sp. TaxID=306 RepID=UPI003A96BF64
MRYPSIAHHDAVTGVAGSCHPLRMDDEHALPIGRGLFQRAGTSPAGRAGAGSLALEFSLGGIKALVAVTAHVDHAGPIPCFLAAGCKRPILSSEPSVRALLIVLDNTFRLGFSRGQKQVAWYLERCITALTQTAQPAIAIVGSGLCPSWRIVNYPKAMLGDEQQDVLLIDHQADGATGRRMQRFGPRSGYVEFDGQRYDIRAQVHTIGGYSAHADQKGLASFVTRVTHWPSEVRIVHGELEAKHQLASILHQRYDAADKTLKIVIS